MYAGLCTASVVALALTRASYHQLVTLRTLFPKVRPGGFYIIEDLDWQPPDLEASLPRTPTMARLLRERTFIEDLGVPLHAVEILLDGKLGIIRKPLAPHPRHRIGTPGSPTD